MQKPASFYGNEEHWQKTCHSLVELTQAVLDGKIGVIAGARKISPFRQDLKAETDPDFLLFVGLDSETDHLPIGEVTRHWNETVLLDKQKEIDRVEDIYKQRVLNACKNLIRKYRI